MDVLTSLISVHCLMCWRNPKAILKRLRLSALKKNGKCTYQAVVIANVASGIRSISDIAGKDMAYGDPASTSSHLIPKSMLAEKGLSAKRHYREHFLGNHDAVAIAVQNAKAQAGGLK